MHFCGVFFLAVVIVVCSIQCGYGASRVSQRVKVLSAEWETLSLILETHRVEGRNIKLS